MPLSRSRAIALADVARTVRQAWDLGAGYTTTRGSHLDMVRAPNRGPNGLRIPDVQAFTWQTSDASSILHAANFRLQRRPVKGIGGGITYTLARSRDDASTLGGGRTTVAQDDQHLDAEWGLSSFDRRHQVSANGYLELPFGPNRPWLNGGGTWAAILENWRVNTVFVERVNGTDRGQNSRKVRKTYRFSKDPDVPVAMTYFTQYSYNFCWCVRTLREEIEPKHYRPRTPAMAAGLADHVWSLEEWLLFPCNKLYKLPCLCPK